WPTRPPCHAIRDHRPLFGRHRHGMAISQYFETSIRQQFRNAACNKNCPRHQRSGALYYRPDTEFPRQAQVQTLQANPPECFLSCGAHRSSSEGDVLYHLVSHVMRPCNKRSRQFRPVVPTASDALWDNCDCSVLSCPYRKLDPTISLTQAAEDIAFAPNSSSVWGNAPTDSRCLHTEIFGRPRWPAQRHSRNKGFAISAMPCSGFR